MQYAAVVPISCSAFLVSTLHELPSSTTSESFSSIQQVLLKRHGSLDASSILRTLICAGVILGMAKPDPLSLSGSRSVFLRVLVTSSYSTFSGSVSFAAAADPSVA